MSPKNILPPTTLNYGVYGDPGVPLSSHPKGNTRVKGPFLIPPLSPHGNSLKGSRVRWTLELWQHSIPEKTLMEKHWIMVIS